MINIAKIIWNRTTSKEKEHYLGSQRFEIVQQLFPTTLTPPKLIQRKPTKTCASRTLCVLALNRMSVVAVTFGMDGANIGLTPIDRVLIIVISCFLAQ